MWKITVIIICIISMVSCKAPNEAPRNESQLQSKLLYEGRWCTNFKNEVFLRCLKKAYPKSFGDLIDSIDGSSSANLDQLEYNKEVLHTADSLALQFLKRDEVSWKIEGKNVILNFCMNYRNSKELDSLTGLLYRKYHKGE